MVVDIAAELEDIDMAPANSATEIMQNVKTILTTPKGTVPLFREFGLDTTLVDDPLPVAQAKYTAQIIETVQKYEPRAIVTKVIYGGDGKDGVLKAKVRVRIEDGT